LALKEEFLAQGNFLFKHRGWLPIPFVFLGLLIFLYRQQKELGWLDGEWLKDTSYYPFYCLLVGLVGLGIRAFTIGSTPKDTSGRNTHGQLANTVNTTGIYSIVRHPLYLGNYFMWVSIVLLTQDLWFTMAFTLAYWLYYERIMYAEEAFLTEKFGQEYLDWASRTPAFIPRFENWTRPSLPLSIRNILKREYTGFMLLFVIFALFDAGGEWIKSGIFLPSREWQILSVAAIFIYFSLRTIRKKTTWLEVAGR